jgi:hypothetical protein
MYSLKMTMEDSRKMTATYEIIVIIWKLNIFSREALFFCETLLGSTASNNTFIQISYMY